MKDWTDIHTKEQLRKRYASYIPALQKIAMSHGYALAVHGSMSRDLDLLAAPWVTKALTAESLVVALEYGMTQMTHSRNHWRKHAEHGTKKPFGRKAYIILIATLADDFEGMSLGHQQRHAVIDLSIMPRTK